MFQSFTRCTVDHPVVLLLDNHESHCSLAALQFCRDNGIHVISFPPHCSHRLQPLDVGVFKPFKTAINKQFETFMRMHPGRNVQVFDIPEMVSRALEIGVNECNIKSGFRSTGIWPINPEIFQEVDFLPSTTTDRADPNDTPNALDVEKEIENDGENQQEISLETLTPRESTSSLNSTLQSLAPVPKAPPRSQKRKGRPPGRTSILTSDLEINRAIKKENAKEEKIRKEEEKKERKKKNQKKEQKGKEEKKKQRGKKLQKKQEEKNSDFQSRKTSRVLRTQNYNEAHDVSDSD